MHSNLPTLFSIMPQIINEEAAIVFLINEQVFTVLTVCECTGNIKKLKNSLTMFRCTKDGCRKSFSLKKGTFFSMHHYPCNELLLFGYLWLAKTPLTSIYKIVACSSATGTNFSQYFRELVSDAVDFEDVVIGGEGVVVEIDESKLGKRKYNRGHRVEGVWVIGGVERTPERRVFLVEVEQRDAVTLTDVIRRHVAPGSTIYTDLWRGYSSLNSLGFQHSTVNHSQEFKVPGTDIHTNTIEGTWNGLKMQIKPRNRQPDVEEHLWEFIWRRRNAADLWGGLLNALREVAYE